MGKCKDCKNIAAWYGPWAQCNANISDLCFTSVDQGCETKFEPKEVEEPVIHLAKPMLTMNEFLGICQSAQNLWGKKIKIVVTMKEEPKEEKPFEYEEGCTYVFDPNSHIYNDIFKMHSKETRNLEFELIEKGLYWRWFCSNKNKEFRDGFYYGFSSLCFATIPLTQYSDHGVKVDTKTEKSFNPEDVKDKDFETTKPDDTCYKCNHYKVAGPFGNCSKFLITFNKEPIRCHAFNNNAMDKKFTEEDMKSIVSYVAEVNYVYKRRISPLELFKAWKDKYGKH
jgi:hypothetical protein